MLYLHIAIFYTVITKLSYSELQIYTSPRIDGELLIKIIAKGLEVLE